MVKQKCAIIVAGGSGTRMKSVIPKQFIHLNSKPIMAHTINRFLETSSLIVVVLPKEHFKTFNDEVLPYCNSEDLTLIEGGSSRFHSVKNGLSAIPANSLVAIHDAVRPLISRETISNSYSVAEEKGSAVVSIALKDSIRRIDKTGKSEAKNRANYFLVQTPQTFDSDLLLKAYNCEYNDVFTDDASVFEHAGYHIELVSGDYRNIKITTPEDLVVAKALMNEKL